MAKVLVSLEDALLRRIDRAARARGLSRSAYLAELARRDLSDGEGPGKSAAARQALARVEKLHAGTPPGDSTSLVRAERDAR
jgi:metal-responsive CopG/Arc/MetJ family transcriptional regulator